MSILKKVTTLVMQLIRSLHLKSELCTNADIDNFLQLVVNNKTKQKMAMPVQISVRCSKRNFCQTRRETFTVLIPWERTHTLIIVDFKYILFRIHFIEL